MVQLTDPHRFTVHRTNIETDLPFIEGRVGRMWLCTLDPPTPAYPAWVATLAMYLMQIPGASPAWDCYLLSIIHLRDIPGCKPTTKHFPEATHEMMLFALDPSAPIDPRDTKSFRRLSPTNFAGQFQIDTDENAIELARLMARGFIDSHLPPEPQGYRISGVSAVEYIQTTLENTAAHLRDGFCPAEVTDATEVEN